MDAHDEVHGAREPSPPKAKVFVEGRYRKLVRDLPQTVFFCPECKGHPRRRRGCARCEGFGKLTRDSVQELVGWVVGAAFKTRKNVFHGAGREDVDVRMLGAGRPFVMEIVNPRVLDVDLAAVEAEINRRNAGRIEVRDLVWSEKARVREIKETPHAKEYEALVELGGAVDAQRFTDLAGQRVAIVQATPSRVAHRRAEKERERWVEYRSFRPVEVERGVEGTSTVLGASTAPDASATTGASTVRVTMRTEHGTYVKEAIHGEGGSTRPSLADLLGVPCKCLALDVLEILDERGAKGVDTRERPPAFGAEV